jgi:CRISPR-associated protein Csd1
MILHRLYELAERQNLLSDPAFEDLPIPYVLVLSEEGKYLGLSERRGEVDAVRKKGGAKKGAPPKPKRDKGKLLSVPKAHGNTANKGFARFFADTLARVLPVTEDEKSARSRETFWQQIDQAATETADPALAAVRTFEQCMQEDEALRRRVQAELAATRPDAGDRCTFAWHPHGGATIVQHEPIRAWFRQFYARATGERQQQSPRGVCQITREFGPFASSHTTKIAGVPKGIASGVALVSNDKAAFESYGLDGAVNAGIGYRAAEGYARALNELIARRLFPGHPTSLRVGDTLFVFWARQGEDLDDLNCLERAEPAEVERLLNSPYRGEATRTVEAGQLYCLCLSGNSARAIVRSYLEVPLEQVRQRLIAWFRGLRIANDTIAAGGQVTGAFPLWMLAQATVREGDEIAPGLPDLLLRTALEGRSVPDHVLAACLQRLRVETSSMRPARMALIRLILNRGPSCGELEMPEQLDRQAPDPSSAYACGRLLAFLARCQDPRSFGAEAPLLQRYYGAASTAPQSVFPLLLRLNRHHLAGIRDENAGFAYNLEAELEERLASFRNGPSGPDFPALLSLAQQGQFALGFYHQRADYRKQSAERKAAEQAASSQ